MLNFENGHTYLKGVRPLETSENGKNTAHSVVAAELERAYAILTHSLLDLEALSDELSDAFRREGWLIVFPSRQARFDLLDETWLKARPILQFASLGELLLACASSSNVAGTNEKRVGATRRMELQELNELAIRLCLAILNDETVQSD